MTPVLVQPLESESSSQIQPLESVSYTTPLPPIGGFHPSVGYYEQSESIVATMSTGSSSGSVRPRSPEKIERSVTRVVQTQGYDVSEAKRSIEQLEAKACESEERARQELSSQRDGFLRAAAEYSEHARDVCAVEVSRAESLATRRHEHTVDLIKRAAQTELGDQKNALMREAEHALEQQRANLTSEAEQVIRSEESSFRSEVSQAEGFFRQQHTQSQEAQRQIQDLSNQVAILQQQTQHQQLVLHNEQLALTDKDQQLLA